MAFLRTTWTLVTLLLSFGRPQDNEDPPTPLSHACGDIIDYSLQGYSWFVASDVIACLTSVPFNPAVGTRFVKYYNQTLQFQSTSAFLRNPPAGYQQPPFDIFASLQTILDRIDSGYYHNQYAFELDIQHVSLYTHDAHVSVDSGILSQFFFSIPYYLIAASTDGISLPQVYVYNDTTSAIQGPALDTIDDIPAIQWLQEYAANQSFGMLEPNADWNQVMVSPSQLIIGSNNPLSGGGSFYSGDSLNVTYKDGSQEEWDWLAYYNSPGWTGPLTTGGDFYNFFVLGLPPSNYAETYAAWEAAQNITGPDVDTALIDTCSNATSWHDISTAYPADTMMHEACLGLFSSGTLTGYLYEDISTAVLSIPTFDAGDPDTYAQAIADFAGNATTADKVIIDLQSCSGGQVDLAFYVFSQFFPNNSPFAGSRLRDHLLANEFGTAMTAAFATVDPNSDDYWDLFGEEWVVTDRINAQTGTNFTSWQDFYGPSAANGDEFSKVEQYDLADPFSFFGFTYPDCYYTKSCAQQWAARDIVILTDGTCSSTCALFVEMMTEAGVRTVTVGGIPEYGPMQAVSGSRGAVSYSSGELDYDADLSDTAGYINDTGMSINYLGITLRDQVQENDTVPTQFLYQPADCRIFWTLESVSDYSSLWHDTYNAIWNDTSGCVPGSVNAQAPKTEVQPATIELSTAGFISHGISQHSEYTPVDAGAQVKFQYCDKKNGDTFTPDNTVCPGQCQPFSFTCSGPSVQRYVCIRPCTINSNTDTCSGTCQATSSVNGAKVAFNAKAKANFNVKRGQCKPQQSQQTRPCPVFQNAGDVPQR